MHRISLNNQHFKGPSRWEDLHAADLLNLATCTCTVSRYTTAFLVMALFKVPQKLFTRLKECQVIQLEPLVKWVFERNTLQNWLIKSIKLRHFTLYGPKNKLVDLTIEEFTYCEAAYERWLENPKPEYLDTLFAVLYRRKPLFGYKRALFDPDRLESGEKLARSVKSYIKRAVAINYAGCRNLIIERHPYIWKKHSEPQEEGVPKVKQPQKPTNWTQLVINLSGDKFGTYQETTKVNLWLVLADFNKKAKDAEEENNP